MEDNVSPLFQRYGTTGGIKQRGGEAQ